MPRPTLAERLANGPVIIGIVHWGLNTFMDREWGFGKEDPAMLNPAKFDADQIVGACKAGGIAFRDCGATLLWASSGSRWEYNGDRTLLPYGHGYRIENHRKPESAIYWRAGSGEDVRSREVDA